MERVFFETKNCSVAKTMDVIGDWWSVLIVLEAFQGTRHFDEFHRNLNISKGILSKRLKALQKHGVLVRVESEDSPRRVEYRRTPKGASLRTVLAALMQGGDEFMNTEAGPPMVLYNAKNGAEVAKLDFFDIMGSKVEPENLRLKAGPGADKLTAARFGES
jgi:DNA-binding HxlR family transcriptional regulator